MNNFQFVPCNMLNISAMVIKELMEGNALLPCN